MANAKNTIQNISLTGTLNLNTLKTDVKQFQGYNEKNSTVFGGELGPLWEMDIPVPPVYYDDTQPPIGVPLNWTKDMQYPLFNSKGDCFVIDVGKYDDRREFSLYKRNNPIFIYNTDDIIQNSAATFNIPYVSKLNIKEHADFVGYLDKNSNDESFKVVYNNKFYSYTGMSERVRNYINNIFFKNKSFSVTDQYWEQCKNSNNQVVTAQGDFLMSNITDCGNGSSIRKWISLFQDGRNFYIYSIDSSDRVQSKTIAVTEGHYNNNAFFVHTRENASTEVIYFVSMGGKIGWDSPEPEFWRAVYTNGTLGDFTHLTRSSPDSNITMGDYILFSNQSMFKSAYTFAPYTASGTRCYKEDFSMYEWIGGKRKEVVLYNRKDAVSAWYSTAYPNRNISDNKITGNDGYGFIPSYNKNTTDLGSGIAIYTLDGNLVSLTNAGAPVASPLSISDFNFTIVKSAYFYHTNVTSYKSNNSWYAVNHLMPHDLFSNNNTQGLIPEGFLTLRDVMSKVIIDNRYVMMLSIRSDGFNIFDIETESFVPNANKIGYINTDIPIYDDVDFDYYPAPIAGTLHYSAADGSKVNVGTTLFTVNSTSVTSTKAGTVHYVFPNGSAVDAQMVICTVNEVEPNYISAAYISGYNAGFTMSGNPFIGYLPNPSIMTYLLDNNLRFVASSGASDIDDIQFYFDYGNGALAPKYIGNIARYNQALYPIASNGNALIPISLTSTVIQGYFNNDLIKNGSTVYPALYWNNNIEIYGYYMLSSMENISGAFALQSQKYAFDDNLIYNINIQDGVIVSSNPICYIKNLRFIGTLPTCAIFYSKFNKTFYKFTGDSIISKMFEASDIDEIRYVAQNPSTLSVWINTDKGVYIISDTDMYRLNLESDNITFLENEAILISGSVKDKSDSSRLLNVQKNISLQKLDDLYIQPTTYKSVELPIQLKTCFYGLGNELKASYDCWYIRLHSEEKKDGYVNVSVNTITDTSSFTETKRFDLKYDDYDNNGIAYIKYQPKYQSAVAMQLELESNIPIYQVSLGVNASDPVTQATKNSF